MGARRTTTGADRRTFSRAAEDAEHFRWLVAGTAEPVGDLRIELGRLAHAEHQVLAREAILHAQIIRQWSDDVVYFTNGIPVDDVDQERFRAWNIAIVDGEIAELVTEDDRLTGVVLVSGHVVPRTAVFVRPRFFPNADLLAGVGCESDTNGWTTVDQTGRTSVPGLWAAGNAVNPRAQVIRRPEKVPPRPSPSTTTWSRRTWQPLSPRPAQPTDPTTV